MEQEGSGESTVHQKHQSRTTGRRGCLRCGGWARARALGESGRRADASHTGYGEGVNDNDESYRYLSHEQTTVRKPDHCAAGAGSTGGQSIEAARRVRGGLVVGGDGARGEKKKRRKKKTNTLTPVHRCAHRRPSPAPGGVRLAPGSHRLSRFGSHRRGGDRARQLLAGRSVQLRLPLAGRAYKGRVVLVRSGGQSRAR